MSSFSPATLFRLDYLLFPEPETRGGNERRKEGTKEFSSRVSVRTLSRKRIGISAMLCASLVNRSRNELAPVAARRFPFRIGKCLNDRQNGVPISVDRGSRNVDQASWDAGYGEASVSKESERRRPRRNPRINAGISFGAKDFQINVFSERRVIKAFPRSRRVCAPSSPPPPVAPVSPLSCCQRSTGASLSSRLKRIANVLFLASTGRGVLFTENAAFKSRSTSFPPEDRLLVFLGNENWDRRGAGGARRVDRSGPRHRGCQFRGGEPMDKSSAETESFIKNISEKWDGPGRREHDGSREMEPGEQGFEFLALCLRQRINPTKCRGRDPLLLSLFAVGAKLVTALLESLRHSEGEPMVTN